MANHMTPEGRAQASAEALIGSFNSNDRDDVATIKAAAKYLIVAIHTAETKSPRRVAIACTHIEEAAMMAVKAIFAEDA